MKTTLIFASLTCLFISNLNAMAQEKVEDKRPVELVVLDQLVGKWNVDMEVKPSEWNKETIKGKAVETNEAVMDGSYISSKTVGESGKVVSISMYGYDRNFNGYRLWWFGAGGQVTEWIGTYDEKARVLTLRSEVGKDLISVATITFKPDGSHTHEIQVKDAAGKTLQHVVATSTRAK